MYGHECDITEPTELAKAISLCASPDILSGIDTVVYCAGVMTPIARIEHLKLEDMRYTFEVNLFGLVAVAQLTLPHLRRARIAKPLNAGYGKLLALSSKCDREVTYHGWSSYCTSKAALTRFVSCLAHEERGITVQGVYPNLTRTGMVEDLVQGGYKGVMADHERERFKTWNRMGEDMVEPPEWCGKAVAKLALGLFEGGENGRTLGYNEHVPRKIVGT